MVLKGSIGLSASARRVQTGDKRIEPILRSRNRQRFCFCHWSIQKPVQKQNSGDERWVESAWCSTGEEERGGVRRVYCSDLGPSFRFEQKQRKHWPTNTHLPRVTLPFLNTCSPCTHTESNQKATAGCKRSAGVKSMAVKPKVINNGTRRDVVHTHTAREDK